MRSPDGGGVTAMNAPRPRDQAGCGHVALKSNLRAVLMRLYSAHAGMSTSVAARGAVGRAGRVRRAGAPTGAGWRRGRRGAPSGDRAPASGCAILDVVDRVRRMDVLDRPGQSR